MPGMYGRDKSDTQKIYDLLSDAKSICGDSKESKLDRYSKTIIYDGINNILDFMERSFNIEKSDEYDFSTRINKCFSTVKPRDIRSFKDQKDYDDFTNSSDKDWMDIITYDGLDYNKIYELISEEAPDYFGLGKENPYEYGTDEYYDFEPLWGQEAYEGYIPSKDMFITGWDIPEGYNCFMAFKIVNKKLKIIELDNKLLGKLFGSMVYLGPKGNSNYNKLHQFYPDIIDLRLD